jgi:glutamyl-tRNA synthetase
MHPGNLRTALFNALLARRDGGRFLVRIEDTDRERSDPANMDAVLADLAWLGLDWQEGPRCRNPSGGAWQSGRGAVYDAYYRQLFDAGRAYRCFCGEAELKRARAAQRAAGQPPRYPGTCAGLSREEADGREAAGEQPALRFRVDTDRELALQDLVRGEQRFALGDIGDFVIRRADGSAAFFFSNAVDDALMGVSHVLRGEDHAANTPRQHLILEALGLGTPVYGHIGLIVGADGAPLAKRHGAASVGELRAQGYLPLALINYLARLGHAYGESHLMTLSELAAGFDTQRLSGSPARFDPDQLNHWQDEAVAAAPTETLCDWLGDADPVPAHQRAAFVEAVRANIRFPADLRYWADQLFGTPGWDPSLDSWLQDAGAGFFETAVAVYGEAGSDWQAYTTALREATGRRGKGLFMPLRVALTAATSGPELARVLRLLPAATVRERLRAASARAAGE